MKTVTGLSCLVVLFLLAEFNAAPADRIALGLATLGILCVVYRQALTRKVLPHLRARQPRTHRSALLATPAAKA